MEAIVEPKRTSIPGDMTRVLPKSGTSLLAGRLYTRFGCKVRYRVHNIFGGNIMAATL